MHAHLKAELEQGRDRLLEMHSNGGSKARELVEEIGDEDGDPELVNFAIGLFDTIGLGQEDKGENQIILTPSDHMLVPSYPGLPADGCTVTFDRDTALSRDDVHFLSWEHPIIQGGMDLVVSESVGTTAVSLLKNKALPVGTMFLELVYVSTVQAPKQSGITRFLPQTPIRMLLDGKGNDLSANVAFDTFNRQLAPLGRHLASKMVGSVQNQIHALIQAGDNIAERELENVKAAANEEMNNTLRAELDRLQALKAVNPNIRDDELEALETQIGELTGYINSAQVQLDSLRVVVVSHN